jgi:hypothetical protein
MIKGQHEFIYILNNVRGICSGTQSTHVGAQWGLVERRLEEILHEEHQTQLFASYVAMDPFFT